MFSYSNIFLSKVFLLRQGYRIGFGTIPFYVEEKCCFCMISLLERFCFGSFPEILCLDFSLVMEIETACSSSLLGGFFRLLINSLVQWKLWVLGLNLLILGVPPLSKW